MCVFQFIMIDVFFFSVLFMLYEISFTTQSTYKLNYKLLLEIIYNQCNYIENRILTT